MSQRKNAITGRKVSRSNPAADRIIRLAELAFKQLIYTTICCSLFSTAAWAQAYCPETMSLKHGEETTYNVYFRWGILMPQAGVAKLSFDTSGGGMSHYRLRFATTRFFDAIYSMRDTLTCYYAPDFSLRFAVKRADEGGYFLTDELTFFYPEQGATIRSHRYTPTQTKIDTTLVSSSAVVFDMLGFIFYLRTLDWNKFGIGDCAISNVAIGRDLVKVVCRYHGRAVVEREHYQYRTHRFVIEVYDEAFEQSKSATEVWVGDDDNHLPIKIRSKLKIGAVEIYYKSAVNLKAPLTCRIK